MVRRLVFPCLFFNTQGLKRLGHVCSEKEKKNQNQNQRHRVEAVSFVDIDVVYCVHVRIASVSFSLQALFVQDLLLPDSWGVYIADVGVCVCVCVCVCVMGTFQVPPSFAALSMAMSHMAWITVDLVSKTKQNKTKQNKTKNVAPLEDQKLDDAFRRLSNKQTHIPNTSQPASQVTTEAGIPENTRNTNIKRRNDDIIKEKKRRKERERERKRRRKEKKKKLLTSIPPSLSPSQVPLSILSLIISIISRRPRPLTQTTKRNPGNTLSYSWFNSANNLPSSSEPCCNFACSAALCADSTFAAPRRGCEDRMPRSKEGSVVRRERRWDFMAVMREG